MSKRKPKFRMGQVVWLKLRGEYQRIIQFWTGNRGCRCISLPLPHRA